jgi:hypothetical protein
VGVGGLVPLLMLAMSSTDFLIRSAAVLAVLGLLVFEWCFVMAGQSVPNS